MNATTLFSILRFLVLAAIGYAGVYAVFVGWLYVFDKLPDDAHLGAFKTSYFGGGLMACILGTGLGTISFFTEGRARRMFLLMPAVLPLAYCVGILIFFKSI